MTDDRYVSPHTDNPRSLECVRCMPVVCVVKSIMDKPMSWFTFPASLFLLLLCHKSWL